MSEINDVSFRRAYSEAVEYLQNTPPAIEIASMKNFTKLFGGFRPREFSILCGATGTGKTTLLANWSLDLCEQKIPHFVASVETGHVDFILRVMSAKTGIQFTSGETFSESAVEHFHNNHGEMILNSLGRLSLYDNRISAKKLIEEIKYSIEHHGTKVVMLDNLNFFMEVTTSANSNIEMDRVVHDFIMFCKQHDVHIVMVMHPKKTQNGRVESEFDIKGSSTAVQEAQNVFLFNRTTEEQKNEDGIGKMSRELKFAKIRRRGENTGKTIILNTNDGVKYSEGAIGFEFN